jgi:hypothetical protein
MADKQTNIDKAEAAAHKADVAAVDTRAKVEADARSPEQKRIDDAAQKADDERAKAEQARAEAVGSIEPMTAEQAKAHIPAPLLSMPASAHLAQKFGNDPANPQLAPGLNPDEGATVRLTRITPDVQDGPVVIMVHPEMVGDYLRAGWSL